MRRNAFIHEGFHAAFSLGGRKAAGPFALLGLVGTATAQNYSVDWFTIDSRGGTNGDGTFSLNSTLGQPDVNSQPASDEYSSLVGGFWSLLAVQIPDAPLLTIRLTSTNTAVILWPSPSSGFTLQQTSDLNTANWVTAPQSVGDNGTNKFIIVNPLVGNRFYRLFKP